MDDGMFCHLWLDLVCDACTKLENCKEQPLAVKIKKT
jgi:hypothetical protein